MLATTMGAPLYVHTSKGWVNLTLVVNISMEGGQLYFRYLGGGTTSVPKDEGKRVLAELEPGFRRVLAEFETGMAM
jgi:hypothetical protein